jgi:hypothetical protein
MAQDVLPPDGIKIEITKPVMMSALLSILFALYAVIFMWGFWQKDVNALGLNFFIFSAAAISVIVYRLLKEKNYSKSDLFWITPFYFIALSFLLYNNLFTKSINFFVMPFLFVFFFTLSFLAGKKDKIWNTALFFKILERVIFFFDKINDACACYLKLLKMKKQGKNPLYLRILAGVALLVVVAVGVVLPLLSSVDSIFADQVKVFYDYFSKIFSSVLFVKAIAFIILAIVFLASSLAWWKKYSLEDDQEKKEKIKIIDPVVVTVVVAGIFLIYGLFIAVQFKRLWLGNLPINFSDTVTLVKSGFWQLFFLSIINVLIFIFSFRKANKAFQIILGFFAVSSLLLLFSSAWRMWLYVTNYGLSYEKFYASYTVIFSFFVFAVLLASFFFKQKLNFLKIFTFTFLWMYSLTTIIPLEHFILNANLALKNRPDSRIRIAELVMLSPDVLGEVEKKVMPLNIETEMWQGWIEKSQKIIADKKWYELSLLDIGRK